MESVSTGGVVSLGRPDGGGLIVRKFSRFELGWFVFATAIAVVFLVQQCRADVACRERGGVLVTASGCDQPWLPVCVEWKR